MAHEEASLPSEVAGVLVGQTNLVEVEVGGNSGRFDITPKTIPEPRLAVIPIRRSQVINTAEYVKINAIAPNEIRFVLDFGHWHPDLKGISANSHLAVGKYSLSGISTNNNVSQVGANGRFLGIEDLVRLFTDWMKAKASFDSGCGSVSCIFQEKLYPHIRVGHGAETQSNNLSTENLYPRPLIGFHNGQLVTENPPTSAGEYSGERNKKERPFFYCSIFLITIILMVCLAFLCITKGYDRGGNLGTGFTFLSFPLLAISIY
jgi:hypothetical protein